MTTTVRKWSYGHYESDNYGGHSMAVQIGNLTLYFSYDTVVAFQEEGHCLRVCENVWSVTTGKHLGWLQPDKKQRIPFDQFKTDLEHALGIRNLAVREES